MASASCQLCGRYIKRKGLCKDCRKLCEWLLREFDAEPIDQDRINNGCMINRRIS